MTDIDIGGNSYQIGKLDAFKQFHLARRIAPVLFSLGGAVSAFLPQDGGESSDVDVLKAIEPMVNVISKMSDADSQYVLNACLSVCSRKQGNGYQRVFVDGSGLMFIDVDLSVMMQLVQAVIQDNLGNFMAALPILA